MILNKFVFGFRCVFFKFITLVDNSFALGFQEFLPEYFQPWNDLAKNVPSLVASKQIREKVNQVMTKYSSL